MFPSLSDRGRQEEQYYYQPEKGKYSNALICSVSFGVIQGKKLNEVLLQLFSKPLVVEGDIKMGIQGRILSCECFS